MGSLHGPLCTNSEASPGHSTVLGSQKNCNACAVVLRSLRTRGIKDAFDPD